MSLKREVIIIPATITENSSNTFAQKNTAAYCRVSTDNEEQLTSYENQLEYYKEKILRNPEWQYAGIFADEGISGTQTNKRIEFNNMIKKCEQGKIDIVLTKSISRFARNTVDCLKYVRLLKSLGIAIIFEKENINTMSAESETLISLLASLAQAESESISGNVKWGKRKGYAQGKATISFNHLLGYEKDKDNNPVIVAAEAEIVKHVFERYLAGGSLLSIKASIEEKGYLTKRGSKNWSTYVIRHMLENEKYVGDVIMQKTYTTDCISKKVKQNNGELPKYWIKNNHPAIIDRVTWNRVQKEKARRNGKRKVADKTKTELSKYSSKYALSELLICGECGSHYRRVTWSRNGVKTRLWRCICRLEHGKKYCRESPTLKENLLENAILSEVNKYISNENLIDILNGNMHEVLTENMDEVQNPFHMKKEMQRLENLRKDLIAGTKDVDVKARSSHYKRIGEITSELSSLQSKVSTVEIKDKGNVILDELVNNKTKIESFDNDIIRQLIDYVRVIDKDIVEVKFRHGASSEVALDSKII
jgi:site-specific DNA recombinase